MGKREIAAYFNIQLVGFQANWAFVFTKPSQEITTHCIESREV
jgi:hypothetical protein